jgi:hypothetical protein
MAKANLVLPNGTKVNIQGSPDEVANLLAKFSGSRLASRATTKSLHKNTSGRSRSGNQRPKRKGPQRLIVDLIEENYFKARRTIGEIQRKLEEKGHIYALYALSTPLLRLTRSKALRRIKDKSGWVYVQ